MAELAFNTGTYRVEAGFLPSAKSKIHRILNRRISTSELVFLALTLSFLQILDGILTGVGVMTFGSDIEANVIIKFLMENMGVFPALLMVKSFALVIILTLCTMINKVPWLASALKGIIVLYIFAAIIPWVMILTFNVA